jgi:hypothetical protein
MVKVIIAIASCVPDESIDNDVVEEEPTKERRRLGY